MRAFPIKENSNPETLKDLLDKHYNVGVLMNPAVQFFTVFKDSGT